MNLTVLFGTVGKDPKFNILPNGNCNAKFSMATKESWKDRDGAWKEKTEWHNCTAWGRLAERCRDNMAKGDSVAVSGKSSTRKWTDKEGKDRWSTEVTCEEMLIQPKGGSAIAPLSDREEGSLVTTAELPFTDTKTVTSFTSDDIPF